MNSTTTFTSTDIDRAAATLPELLRWRASTQPQRVLYTFVASEGSARDLTVGELHHAAADVAGELAQRLHARDRVLLAYPPGPEFITAFLGCLYADAVPVPVILPTTNRDRLRAVSITRDARPALVLTTTEHLDTVRRAFDDTTEPRVTCEASDDPARRRGALSVASSIGAKSYGDGELAYLQYTSGSTNDPKGVCLTHRCVMHNLGNIALGFQHGPDDVSVNWLPHYHDMGLVYGLLQPLFSGFLGVQMSPVTFLKQPIEWLRAITRWRATHSGAPNFAYELCVQRVSERDRHDLNLESWKVAYCGAEPVRHSSLARFQETYARVGFRATSFTPAYGLAEATLKVSAGAFGRELRCSRPVADRASASAEPHRATPDVVSCGPIGLDTDVRIVDPVTFTERSEGHIGEVWVSGPGVAAGYWERAAESAWTFRNVLPGVPGREYLRTGDLGFLDGRELFITGRLKDVIIIGGYNVFAEDIEAAVMERDEVLRSGVTAAFGLEIGGTEKPVVVYELSRHVTADPAQVALDIRRAVADRLDLVLHAVALVGRGDIPRTSSGKVRRRACREAYVNGTLSLLYQDVLPDVLPALLPALLPDGAAASGGSTLSSSGAARPGIDRGVARQFLAVQLGVLTGLTLEDDDWDLPLTSLGVDSLRAVRLMEAVHDAFGASLDPASLLSGLTVNELLKALQRGGASPAAAPELPFVPADAATPASFEQARLWLIDRHLPDGALNLGAVVQLEGAVDPDVLRGCLRELAARHASLRGCVRLHDGEPAFHVAPAIALDLPVFDLRTVSVPERAVRLREMVDSDLRRPFDLGAPPLMRFTLAILDDGKAALTICAHHAVCDYRSLRMLIAELGAMRARACAVPTISPPIGVEYAQFIAWQRQQCDAGAWDDSLRYWREQLAGFTPKRPASRSDRESSMGHGHDRVVLDPMLTGLLRGCAADNAATPFMVMLAAVATWLHARTGDEDLVLACPVSGRWVRGTGNTVGLFAYPIPLRVRLGPETSFHDVVRRVRATAIGAYRHQHVPFSKIATAAAADGVSPRDLAYALCNLICIGDDAVAPDAGVSAVDWHQSTSGIPVSVTWIENGAAVSVDVAGFAEFLAHAHGRAAESLADCVARCLRNPAQAIGETAVARPAGELDRELDREPGRHGDSPRLVCASTFTGAPLRDSLEFWLSKLNLDAAVRFEPDGQVFQVLLDPTSTLRSNPSGMNVLLVRVYDWCATGPDQAQTRDALRRAATDFADAVRAAARQSRCVFLVCLCPGQPSVASDALATMCEEAERAIEASLADVPNVSVVSSAELLASHAGEHADRYGERLSNIPYMPTFFAAMGTIVARRYLALHTVRPKVIVVDCDNTLWRGQAAEDSHAGVVVDRPAEALQRMLLARRESGVLLALCSKNEPEDVWQTFESASGMHLRREHVTAWRINWNAKSSNLRALSDELGVEASSFVFIDDDPVECAEVRAHCPEVYAFQLPAGEEERDRFLANLWPLDLPFVTAADRARAVAYEVDKVRREAEQRAPTLAAFVASLLLRITIEEMQESETERVAQLTVRTTQMNANPTAMTAGELLAFQRRADTFVQVAHVRDRFGEYGLVGVLGGRVAPPWLDVDIFLLSCRALGRGVEHRMLQHLGTLALERGLDGIRIAMIPTPRNEPARRFLTATCRHATEAGRQCWTIRAEDARHVAYVPADASPATPSPREADASPARQAGGPPIPSALWQDIADQLNTPERILAAMRATRPEIASPVTTSLTTSLTTSSTTPSSTLSPTSRSLTEQKVAAIWSELIGFEQTDLDQDFFAAGGHSLMAMELARALQRACGVEVPVATIFSGKLTVAELARHVESFATAR